MARRFDLPVPGWTAEYEWDGWIPPDELPWAKDPGRAFLATANNRPHDEAYPHLIGLDFSHSRHLEGILDDTRQMRTRAFHAAAQMFRRVRAQDAHLDSKQVAMISIRGRDPMSMLRILPGVQQGVDQDTFCQDSAYWTDGSSVQLFDKNPNENRFWASASTSASGSPPPSTGSRHSSSRSRACPSPISSLTSPASPSWTPTTAR